MEINLTTPVTREGETSTGKVLKWEDDPDQRIVQARVRLYENEDPRLYTLWCGADYDAIGDWTTAQAVDRLTELIEANVYSLPPVGDEE